MAQLMEYEAIETRYWREAFRQWFHQSAAVHDTNSAGEWVEKRARELSDADKSQVE